jgi:hypothetical protein
MSANITGEGMYPRAERHDPRVAGRGERVVQADRYHPARANRTPRGNSRKSWEVASV